MKKKAVIGIIYIITIIVVVRFFSINSNPGSSFYSIKRLEEKIIINIKTDPNQKADYYAQLLNLRLYELENAVKSNNTDHILPISLRYAAAAGEYTNFLKANRLTNKTNEAVKHFEEHEKILKKLISTYRLKNVADNTANFLVDDINYLEGNRKQL